MRVAELWRFPVKSLQGEQLDDVTIGPHGIVGDRGYALFDAETGFGLTARRAPELLFASGRLRDDGSAAITLPDGSIADDDEALSSWLGRSVLLRSTSDDVTRRYENPVDPEHEELSRWEPFDGSHGAFHDEPGASISLVSSATIAGWQTRRSGPTSCSAGRASRTTPRPRCSAYGWQWATPGSTSAWRSGAA